MKTWRNTLKLSKWHKEVHWRRRHQSDSLDCFEQVERSKINNLDDTEFLSSVFPGLRTSAASFASVTSLASPISPALFHQRTSWSWWLDHPWHQNDQYWSFFCGMDHQKSNFSLISNTISIRGCWGQPMLLFWKLVDKTQMSKPIQSIRHYNSRKCLILLPLRAIYSRSFHYETPCNIHTYRIPISRP